jgi:hypothetical protein
MQIVGKPERSGKTTRSQSKDNAFELFEEFLSRHRYNLARHHAEAKMTNKTALELREARTIGSRHFNAAKQPGNAEGLSTILPDVASLKNSIKLRDLPKLGGEDVPKKSWWYSNGDNVHIIARVYADNVQQLDLFIGNRYFAWENPLRVETGFLSSPVTLDGERINTDKWPTNPLDRDFCDYAGNLLLRLKLSNLEKVVKTLTKDLNSLRFPSDGTFLSREGMYEVLPTRVDRAHYGEQRALLQKEGAVWFRGSRYTEFMYLLDGKRLLNFEFYDRSSFLRCKDGALTTGQLHRAAGGFMAPAVYDEMPEEPSDASALERQTSYVLELLENIKDPDMKVLKANLTALLAGSAKKS